MSRKYSFAPGEYYHIYNRGIEKRDIFLDDRDKNRFLTLLLAGNSEKNLNMRHLNKGLTFAEIVNKRGERIIDIGAYCLITNHFHILVKQKGDKGISAFMQRVMTAYTMYFNTKYQRKGRLFESSYLSKHADYDEYLKYLVAYIHLNPLKLIDKGWKDKKIYKEDWAKSVLSNYPYSSYQDYMGVERDQKSIINQEEFPDYFKNNEEFSNYLEYWLNSSL